MYRHMDDNARSTSWLNQLAKTVQLVGSTSNGVKLGRYVTQRGPSFIRGPLTGLYDPSVASGFDRGCGTFGASGYQTQCPNQAFLS